MLADRMAIPITIFLAVARLFPRNGFPFPAVRVVMSLLGRWGTDLARPCTVRLPGVFPAVARGRGNSRLFRTKRELPSARCDLAKAREAYLSADPRGGAPDLLLLLDNALSYAHRVIDDLLHEIGLPPHHPMDFESWYDTPEVPFQDDL